MKATKTLPIIGMAFGSLIILLSLSFMFLTHPTPNNQNSYNKENSYDSANVNTLNQIEGEVEGKVESQKNTPEELKEEVTPYVLKESGWIPDWAFDLGLESLENNLGIIHTALPVLYTVNKEGDIISRGVSEEKIQELVSFCKENNITMIPTVGSYDFKATESAFKDSSSYKKQVEKIIEEIERYGFDGIDLDYEMVNSSYKENFLKFLKELSSELEKRDKILSVTVFAKWEDGKYTNHQETRVVQDYSEIAKYADEVRIMAYDYTLQSSEIPGPIAPIDWVRDVLDYAIERIPKEKIWLGVHLYGYQWDSNKTIAFTYTTALSAIVNDPDIEYVYKEDIGEAYSTFNCSEGYICKAYFQSPEGIADRRELAKEYNIAGISYWRLGGELDLLK
jgi:spore germination protein YaaH